MLRIIISFQNNIFPLVPKSFHHLPLIWGAFTTSPSNTIFKQIFKLRTVDFFYFTLANKYINCHVCILNSAIPLSCIKFPEYKTMNAGFFSVFNILNLQGVLLTILRFTDKYII